MWAWGIEVPQAVAVWHQLHVATTEEDEVIEALSRRRAELFLRATGRIASELWTAVTICRLGVVWKRGDLDCVAARKPLFLDRAEAYVTARRTAP